jgi:hypothetical protein
VKYIGACAAGTLLALGLFAHSAVADAPRMFFEGDTVLGQACVLKSRFTYGEGVVWRVRVLDAATGAQLDSKKLKSLVVELGDGNKVAMKYGGHPRGGTEDAFWSTSWKVPEGYPTGTLGYTIIATDLEGHEVRWQPFTIKNSLLTIED